jgi:hypothetical protein
MATIYATRDAAIRAAANEAKLSGGGQVIWQHENGKCTFTELGRRPIGPGWTKVLRDGCTAFLQNRTMADIGRRQQCRAAIYRDGLCRRHHPETQPARDKQGRIVRREERREVR